MTRPSNKILDQISSDAAGVIWISEGPIDLKVDFFDEFNYLFDGLLSQFLKNNDKHTDLALNSFHTTNFGKSLFLVHINTLKLDKKKVSELLQEQVSLISAMKNENKLILTLNQSKEDWISDLKSHFQRFEFKNLL